MCWLVYINYFKAPFESVRILGISLYIIGKTFFRFLFNFFYFCGIPVVRFQELRKLSFSFVSKKNICSRKLFQSSLWICKNNWRIRFIFWGKRDSFYRYFSIFFLFCGIPVVQWKNYVKFKCHFFTQKNISVKKLFHCPLWICNNCWRIRIIYWKKMKLIFSKIFRFFFLFLWDPCGAIPKLRTISYSFVF
jgi:hypothetical protein